MNSIKSVKHVSCESFVIFFLLSLLLVGTAWADSRVDTVINSTWKFNKADVANAQQPSFDDSSWSTIDVPHTWNALDGEDGGTYYRGIGWYRKHYTIGSEFSGKRVYLFFESVGNSAEVYCNGTLVGSHLGAYAAFCFDITSAVAFGADNLIAVKANNSSSLGIAPLSGDFTQWGGICRNVRLLITNTVHITPLDYASPGVYLTTTNVSSTSGDLSVKTLIRNAGAPVKNVTVTATIKDAADITVGTPLTLTQNVAAGVTNFVQNTTVSNPHLWDGLADPYLYKVIVEVQTDSAVVDTVQQPLGFRYYTVNANTGFFLNGHYLDLHGTAIHEDRDHKGRAISDADRQEDMQIMLEMGCTWLRPSHYQHAEKMYDLADQTGMILTTEIPLVNLISTTQAFSDNCQSQLKELIRQNYNHPSILFWCIFNEITLSGGPDSNALIVLLNTLAKAEDPTRPTTAANNTSDTNTTSTHTDVLGYNKYFGWYFGAATDFGPWATNIHAIRGSDKIGVTEYGAGASINHHEENAPEPANAGSWHPEEYQSYYHEVHWKAMEARPFLWCKAIWNGFDFGSDGRNEGDRAGINDKGLVLRDRTVKKDSFYWYKANWSSTPMVYITSRRYTPRTQNPGYVKVYSNCDSVELFINGVSKGVLTSTDHIYQWNSVTLRQGANEIKTVGRTGTNEYTDVCNWDLTTAAKKLTMQISAVTASGFQAGNPPGNSIDGSMTTRWACQGVGSWIKYDLGVAREVQGVKIAFYSGNSRRANFDIHVSNDNSTWTSVLAGGVSSGTTTDFEEFDFPDTSARYLRITANGTSAGDWNSFFEVEICGVLLCADVLACGLKFDADLSGSAGTPDCHIDIYDLKVMAADWLQSIPTGGSDLSGPAGIPDYRVDFYDLAVMSAEWMQCNIPNDPACI
jgi:beta-galactosidase